MKPRARRVTLTAAVLGVSVLAVLVVAHWGTVRDHVEAWRFQFTRDTKMIEPDPTLWIEITTPDAFLHALANHLGWPVVYELSDWPLLAIAGPITAEETIEICRRVYGYRVIEQRFPRRAYVVIRDAEARQFTEARLDEEEDLQSILDELDPTKPGNSGTP